MIIAVDGMGGDNAPKAVVKACTEAVNEFSVDIIITGNEKIIAEELENYNYNKNKIDILNTTEIITQNEHPVMAIRKKKDSSLYRALNLVKEGKAQAVISAGSTGALMAGATFIVGRIRGIDRIALAPIIPGKNRPFMLVDAGANVDCKPQYLLQFAFMGKVYFENILKVENPSIGLINIGLEEEKGNELTKKTYELLKKSNLNFTGNVEPRDISSGDVNILVCDGFVGNTVLKMYEGVASNIFSMLKSEIMSSMKSKIGGLLLKPVFKNFKNKFDYTEYGGSAFLGTKGIVLKAHGSSDEKAFKNAIKQAKICYEGKFIEKISGELENINNLIDKSESEMPNQ
ncbi:phosphate acyltransferase [Clostridium pasteurianum DSM 525 = ATCC 6013]|uniref:Phosphate acyltransferase n=1 Tax=Clostridium pasteurianum DSM 525 = ATCC 6013 TaxID=1262449 RepID=A0A0H3J3X5_CLOPA|nr:phosphate acyltransferase PlsX [Clostridium pasteurianum]AJA48149.1 phosphate acyltransferase [Clostridium pasteurianum DSM 525 = ATCC 6013]AJA52137.1 phosphate acyltransferase [Clostridium pasteurianum DSM 525 = ATCC 6013]AOZ75411.1 phosphate acyltransferase [Clostridium pasteurianum DSM 525 = ATCC 6013]AOZ79206.1 phosphate acyltransferase [Clostridium pasteurianum]ELP60699.1 phosphate acyltransferase [Clostridium pasteurianum DSM 525 = ATCC 6013]